MRNKAKRSQAWGMDMMIAVIIFSSGIIIFFIYAINSDRQEKTLENLKYEGDIIASSLLSSGSPAGWTEADVTKIGILDGGKINETKLAIFYNLSISDYQKTKSLLNTKYNYYFFLSENMTIDSVEIAGIGLVPGNQEELVKVTRFTVYKDKVVNAYVYVWQ